MDWCVSREISGETIAAPLCVAAGWITLLVFNIERWVDLDRIVQTGIAQQAWDMFFTNDYQMAVLGLPAACIGRCCR